VTAVEGIDVSGLKAGEKPAFRVRLTDGTSRTAAPAEVEALLAAVLGDPPKGHERE
jgi:hypothetical protein